MLFRSAIPVAAAATLAMFTLTPPVQVPVLESPSVPAPPVLTFTPREKTKPILVRSGPSRQQLALRIRKRLGGHGPVQHQVDRVHTLLQRRSEPRCQLMPVALKNRILHHPARRGTRIDHRHHLPAVGGGYAQKPVGRRTIAPLRQDRITSHDLEVPPARSPPKKGMGLVEETGEKNAGHAGMVGKPGAMGSGCWLDFVDTAADSPPPCALYPSVRESLIRPMRYTFPVSQSLYERAGRCIASGVNSGIRKLEAPVPLYFARGSGPELWDVDGNHYLD